MFSRLECQKEQHIFYLILQVQVRLLVIISNHMQECRSLPVLSDWIQKSTNTDCYFIRRVWIYQRGNQNSHIEEQTTQWPNEKLQKDKQRSTKHTQEPKRKVRLVLFLFCIHDVINIVLSRLWTARYRCACHLLNTLYNVSHPLCTFYKRGQPW